MGANTITIATKAEFNVEVAGFALRWCKPEPKAGSTVSR